MFTTPITAWLPDSCYNLLIVVHLHHHSSRGCTRKGGIFRVGGGGRAENWSEDRSGRDGAYRHCPLPGLNYRQSRRGELPEICAFPPLPRQNTTSHISESRCGPPALEIEMLAAIAYNNSLLICNPLEVNSECIRSIVRSTNL